MRLFRVRLFRYAVVLGFVLSSGVVPDAIRAQEPRAELGFPAELELETTVQDGFTIAVVCDIIIANPQSMNPDPGFQAVLRILDHADVVTGNYEGNIIDGRTFAGSGPGGFAGTPAVAADLKAMGFDIVARSNNHAGEYGYEGHLETNRWLDPCPSSTTGQGGVSVTNPSTPEALAISSTAAAAPASVRSVESSAGAHPNPASRVAATIFVRMAVVIESAP